MKTHLTIYDIAKLAGVSPATVSRVIHQSEYVREATSQKVWKAFKDAGISPDDLSFKANTGTKHLSRSLPHVPVILTCIPGWDNPFYNDVLEGIQTSLQSFGYKNIVYTTPLSKYYIPEFLELAASLQISGLIIMDQLPEDIIYCLSAHYPLVQCSEHNPVCQNIPSVTVDNFTVSKDVVSQFIRLGCKRIGFFSAPYQFRYVQARFRAYKAVLQQASIPANPEYIMMVSDYSYERILSAAKRFFLMAEPPDSIFAVSDKHAHAVVKAAQLADVSVPGDIKVIGFDDTMYATLSTPTITTVQQPKRELGSQSARLLVEMLQNPGTIPESIVLPTKIIWREST